MMRRRKNPHPKRAVTEKEDGFEGILAASLDAREEEEEVEEEEEPNFFCCV